MSMVKSGMDDLGGATGALQSVVEKWLGGRGSADMQITDGGGTGRYPGRYVRIEAPCRKDGAAMYFFLHDDGSWNVCPQEVRGVAMSTHLFAA